MTRPFSTWQLREGWANLHSASDREQVPLWNSRHTSRVSHLVSRPMVMLTAIGAVHKYWAGETDGRKTVCREQGWLIVMQEKVPDKNTEEEKEAKIFFLSTYRQRVLLVGLFKGIFISSSWEKWQLKFHWVEIEGGWLWAEASSVSKNEKKEKKGKTRNYSEDITLAFLDMSSSICVFTWIDSRPP